MLPAVAFFELMSNPVAEDWPLCDPSASLREPSWVRDVLEILSALQMDGDWLLGLSEEEQAVVATAISAMEAGAALDKDVGEDVHQLLAEGARGTACGMFELRSSESEACLLYTSDAADE